MFTHNSSVGKTRGWVSLILVPGLLVGALVLAGCSMEDDAPDYGDALNSGLIGTWKHTSDYGDTIYTITAETLAESGSAAMATYTGDIEYIYNFSNTAGVIIVKYTVGTDYSGGSLIGKYSAIYFKNLTENTVVLGDAYTAADSTVPVEVTTRDEAIEKFKPENMAKYGGELTYAGVLTRQ